ncbi:MAG: endonuclease/exonuclease/phosphatase family protein [Planctomycetota bacterium]
MIAMCRGMAGVTLLAVTLSGCSSQEHVSDNVTPPTVRVALFNIKELSVEKLAAVTADGHGSHPQLLAAAAVIRDVRPDILVLQEMDHAVGRSDDLTLTTRQFCALYLADLYPSPHLLAEPCNTGRLSGVDLDGDGHIATDADRGERRHGGDSWGYGTYPGQYSMAVVSRFPIDRVAFRSFRKLRWSDYPGHHIGDALSDEAREHMRLSSKSHWVVPVQVGSARIELFVSHPTPPVFDGPEDRNGRRNFDEVGFWAKFLSGERFPSDQGDPVRWSGAPFIVVGDLNARPDTQESHYDGRTAIAQLLEHPQVQPIEPTSATHGPATADFGGGARVDYLLPDRRLDVIQSGVFWPSEQTNPKGADNARAASDHRLLWIDLHMESESGEE